MFITRRSSHSHQPLFALARINRTNGMNEECAACFTTRRNVLKTWDFAYFAVCYWKGNRTKLLLLLIFMGSTEGVCNRIQMNIKLYHNNFNRSNLWRNKLQSLPNNECDWIYQQVFPFISIQKFIGMKKQKNSRNFCLLFWSSKWFLMIFPQSPFPCALNWILF